MRLIKKYKNRRLYDTELSQYITIDDLQQYIINEIEFRVLDTATNADLTSATLLQILVEMEVKSTPLLSDTMLRQLIILSKHPMHQSCKQMLESMTAIILQQAHDNPYLMHYKQASETWEKQTQSILEQWQQFFK